MRPPGLKAQAQSPRVLLRGWREHGRLWGLSREFWPILGS